MAKALLCTARADGKFVVTTVYPDGTNLTTVPNPSSGQILVRVYQDGWSVNDELPTDLVANATAIAVAYSATTNWNTVKTAIN